MIRRHQLPASSPLHLGALRRGLGGILGADRRTQLIEEIRACWNVADAALVDSGTSALRLALEAATAERPGPVALPAYACYDVATAAIGARARVILYDVDPDTLAPVPESLKRALEHTPSALVLIHSYGIPVDIPAIQRLVRAETLIIEDAAQAFGASIHGAPAGAHGWLGILSFGRGKGLTGGGGGAVITKDDRGIALIDRIRSAQSRSRPGWSEWLRCSMQWLLARPALYAIPASIPFLRLGETVLHEPHDPRPMTRSAVNIVRAVWGASRQSVIQRQANARRLSSFLDAHAAWRSYPVIGGGTAGYLRFPIRHLSRGRAEILTPDARRLGIIEGYPRTLAEVPEFRDRCINGADAMPGARLLANSLITLPTHGLLSALDLLAIEAWLSAHGQYGARNLSGTHAVA